MAILLANSALQSTFSCPVITFHSRVLPPSSAVKEQMAAEVKAWEEKHSELDLKFNRLQNRAKQRIQELTKVSLYALQLCEGCTCRQLG